MKFAAITLMALLALLTGCASGPKPKLSKSEIEKIDWSPRIGSYTWAEAMVDLGRPSVIGEESDGKVAEWVLKRSPQMSFGLGVGSGSYGRSGGVGVGVGSSVSPPPKGENLRLKFDKAEKLKEWRRVRY